MSLPILKEEVYQRLCEELARGIDAFVPLPGMGGALASDLVREHEARQAKTANPIDWSAGVFPTCRICHVASVLDAATQSVCESCFCRLVSHIWRVMPLVQSLVLQHRIDSGPLPKFAPDPELQARAERAKEAYAAKQAEDLKRAQEVYRQRQQETAQKMRTQARTPQEQLNAASELRKQAKPKRPKPKGWDTQVDFEKLERYAQLYGMSQEDYIRAKQAIDAGGTVTMEIPSFNVIDP